MFPADTYNVTGETLQAFEAQGIWEEAHQWQ